MTDKSKPNPNKATLAELLEWVKPFADEWMCECWSEELAYLEGCHEERESRRIVSQEGSL